MHLLRDMSRFIFLGGERCKLLELRIGWQLRITEVEQTPIFCLKSRGLKTERHPTPPHPNPCSRCVTVSSTAPVCLLPAGTVVLPYATRCFACHCRAAARTFACFGALSGFYPTAPKSKDAITLTSMQGSLLQSSFQRGSPM